MPAAAAALVTCGFASSAGHWREWALAWALGAVGAILLAVALSRATSARVSRGRWLRDAAWLVVLTCVLACVVAVSADAKYARDIPPEVHVAIADGGTIEVVGVVVSDAREAGRDVWTGERRWSVTVAVRAACAVPCAGLVPARMKVSAVLDAPAATMLGDLVHVVGSASPSSDSRVAATIWEAQYATSGAADRELALVGAFRAGTRSAAEGLPDAVRGLVLGMVIGDVSAMPADLQADMKVTSLTHLTAVSGSHFAIVVLVLGWLLVRVVRWRWLRAGLLAGAMWALAAVVLPEPSVLRALTMAIAVALGWWWGRPARALPALGSGVVLLLLIEPGLGGALGFQLSVVAVVSIVVWSPYLAQSLSRILTAGMARIVSVPLAAWLACWPLLVAVQPGVGPYAVPANLVSAVAAFPVTVVGLVSSLVAVVWPAAGAAGMHVAGWCAWPVVWAARAFADAPGAWLAWPAGLAGSTLAGAVSMSLCFASAARRVRGFARLAVAVVAAVVALLAPTLAVRAGPAMDDWAVVVCDVGQGDMMLVRVDNGVAVVVDTGPPGGLGAACLQRYGIEDVPLLVLTHPHADHDGAVTEIASVARIGVAWVSPAGVEGGHEAGADDASRAGADVVVATAGMTWSEGQTAVTVLYPPTSPVVASTSSQLNDASVALWIRVSGTTALALGDLEVGGQRALDRLLDGQVVVDLVKVAHHGSGVQDAALAGRLTARVAAVSVGADNGYGHPAESTLELYARSALLVLTTAECHDIAVGYDANVASSCPSGVAG